MNQRAYINTIIRTYQKSIVAYTSPFVFYTFCGYLVLCEAMLSRLRAAHCSVPYAQYPPQAILLKYKRKIANLKNSLKLYLFKNNEDYKNNIIIFLKQKNPFKLNKINNNNILKKQKNTTQFLSFYLIIYTKNSHYKQ